MARVGEVVRETKETRVDVRLDLDGTGKADLRSGVPFLDHMLDQLARHGRFDLRVHATGDLAIDAHHTTEDVGICLGVALDRALGDRRGLARFGHAYAPLDEALGFCCVDFSGRGFLVFDAPFEGATVGAFPLELVEDFFQAVAVNSRSTWHVQSVRGRNLHHRAESIFKASALALAQAIALDPRRAGEVPSTKGAL